METISAISNFLTANMIWVVVGFAVAAVILLILVIRGSVKQRRLKEKYEKFMQGKDGKNLEEAMLANIEALNRLRSEYGTFREYVENVIEEKGKKSLYKTNMVRYDALEGAGGQMSFAWAVLDDNNDGYIINHIYYRDGSSVFGKIVSKGESVQRLSEEEKQALEGAKNVRIG